MTTVDAGAANELASLLRQKIALLEELRHLLAEETLTLTTGGHERLLAIAEDKRRLGLRLADLSGLLSEQLSRAGYAADGAGLAHYVDAVQDSEAVAPLYAAALDLLRDCAARNQTNGGLVERRRAATERALRVLFACPDDGGRYHASGRLEGVGANRLIGEA